MGADENKRGIEDDDSDMATVHHYQHPLPSLQTTVHRVERGSEQGSTMKGGRSMMNRVSQQ